MIVTTTNAAPGRKTVEGHGLVSGQAAFSVAEKIPAESQAAALAAARAAAGAEARAVALGANAVVGLRFHFQPVPDQKIVIVLAVGTAVSVE